jgi:hypothetical protein
VARHQRHGGNRGASREERGGWTGQRDAMRWDREARGEDGWSESRWSRQTGGRRMRRRSAGGWLTEQQEWPVEDKVGEGGGRARTRSRQDGGRGLSQGTGDSTGPAACGRSGVWDPGRKRASRACCYRGLLEESSTGHNDDAHSRTKQPSTCNSINVIRDTEDGCWLGARSVEHAG